MKTTMLALIAGCLLMLAGEAVAGPRLDAGMKAYAKKDYARAMKDFQADGGAAACFSLGSMYYKGEGTVPNPMEAAGWFKKAAEKGHPQAQFILGVLYIQGDGVAQDRETGLQWLKKAANQGHAESQFRLGVMHINGDGVPKDRNVATAWLKKASKNGHPQAQKLLKVLDTKDKQERQMSAPVPTTEAKAK